MLTKGKYAKNYIKELREDRGVSLRDLAEITGILPQTISNVELSKAALTWEMMQKFSKALECHPMEITEGPIGQRTPLEQAMVQKFRGLEEGKQRMFVSMIDAVTNTDEKKL